MRRFLARLPITFQLIFAYIRKHSLFFAIGLIGGLLIVFLTPQVFLKISNRTRDQVVGLVGNYTVASLPLSVQKKISYGLTTISEDGMASSGASLRFEATDSGKTFTLFLNPNLSWQDGTKFTSANINYTLKGVTIEKMKDRVIFHLKEPYSPLPMLLSQPLFKSGVSRVVPNLPTPINNYFFSSPLIGLGDYRVDQIKSTGRFVSSLKLTNMVSQENLIYKFYPTPEVAISALKTGQVNSVQNIYEPGDLFYNPYYSVTTKVQGNVEAMLFFNMNDQLLAEKSVRQALAYALPDTFTQGKVADSPLPLHSWAQSPLLKKYPQNLESASSMIEKIASGSGSKLKIDLSVNTQLLPTAKEIAANWLQAGVETNINAVDLRPQKFQAYLTLVEIPADPDQYFLWHSTQITNLANYRSFKVDRLLEEGRKTFDDKVRAQKYADFQKAITEDVPAAFLFYPTVYDVTRIY